MKAIQIIKSNLLNTINVLRHGLFLSLYSYIKKASSKLTWRSRTSSPFTTHSLSTHIRNVRLMRISGVASSFLLGLLALAIIIPLYNVTGTEDTEAATSYNEASITLTAVRSSATITADANTIGSSSFALISSNLTSSDTTQYAEYNVKTTNATGYTIGIATNTASTSTNLTSGSNTLSSLVYDTTTMNGISSSDYNNLNTTSYNNTWALYPGTVGNSANSKFYPISNNTITMGTTTAANSTVTSSNTYKVGLAARITMNQASGTYTTTSNDNFKVTAVGNAAVYNITYDKNTSDNVSNLPDATGTMSTTSQSIGLSSTTPTRANFNFLGWCTVTTSDQANGTSGNTACTNAGGIYYTAGGTFHIDETTRNTTTLYAIWEQALISLGYMQDFTNTTCDVATGDYYIATDKRDNKVYSVRYINDYCWMTQNLAYLGDTGSTTGTMTIGNNNSNVSNMSEPITLYSLNSSDAGNFGAYSGHCDETNGYDNACVYDSGSTSTGVWYNYYAASAGTISTNSNSTTATQDICPAGWHLPTGPNTTSGTDINKLVGNTTSGWQSATTGLTAFSAVAGGSYGSGSLSLISRGFWWSATASNTTSRHYLLYESSDSTFNADYRDDRYYGLYVRCVKTPDYTVTVSTSNATGVTINDTTYTNGQQITLHSGVPYTITGTYASGYEFGSWSVSGNATLGSTSSATTTLTVAGNATLTLTGKSSCAGNMQDYTSTALSSLVPNTGDSVDLCDSRDGNTYKVAKLADGSIWMLDNLALDLVAKKDVLNSSNTNATDAELGYLKGTSTGTTSDKYATAAIANWTSSNSYSAPLQSLTDKDKTVTSYGSGSGKVGGYYNYCAASAGTYCYGDGTSQGTSSGNATADICPKGWQMPSTTSSNNVAGSYYYLYNTAYSANASNFRTALSTPLSGTFYDGSASNQGSYGGFWSSTRSSDSVMYGLYVSSSNVYPASYDYRDYGVSVRCVMTPPTMQDATSSSLADLMPNVGDTATLIDSRDGKSYLIGHLADGKYWMLDNLRLGSTSTISLNSSDTNLPSGVTWTLPASGSWTNSRTTAYINSTDKDKTTASYGSGSGKIGVYYNYCAASAGNICVYSNSNNGSADRDICPKGWRMPTGGSPGEYNALYTNSAIGSNATNFRNALSTPLSGYFNGGKAYDQGSLGYFWSSTRDDNDLMRNLFINSSYVYPTSNNGRYYGYSVRCVLK